MSFYIFFFKIFYKFYFNLNHANINIMKKVMLCYPPGDLAGNIKNRYKFNTKDIFPRSMKACNDLGYIAAMLTPDGHEVFLKDYKIEEKTALDFLDDILKFSPDIILLTTNSFDVFEDLKLVRMIKSSNPNIVVVLKSGLFFNPSNDLLSELPLGGADYLIGADAAFVFPRLIKAHFENPDDLYQIPFITICKNGLMQKTNFHIQRGNINDLPFPARSLMNNEYYYRPDNRQVIATIHTGYNNFSLQYREPILPENGENIRPPKKVFDEMYECFSQYGIRSFLFPSDTFNHSEKWVEEFCDLIIASPMKNNIDWIANINIANFTEYTAMEMKQAGCSMVIMRFDCGTDDSLLRLKRGFSIDESYNAAEIAKNLKLKIYGLYSMGYPWEDESHLNATKKMMNKICSDEISLTLPVPYPESLMEKLFRDENILKDNLITDRGIRIPTLGTKFLTHKFLRKYRRKTLLGYYINPKFIFKQVIKIYKDPTSFKNYINFVIELFKNQKH